MTKKLAKSWESHLIGIIGILIASNAYFVQRVISQVDLTMVRISELSEKVGRLETRLDDNIGRCKR